MPLRPWSLLLLALLPAGCAAPIARPTGSGPVGEASGRWRQQAHWVPVADADGTPRLLYAQVCRPEGSGPVPVMVFVHGTGPDRPVLEPQPCSSEANEWFLRRASW